MSLWAGVKDSKTSDDKDKTQSGNLGGAQTQLETHPDRDSDKEKEREFDSIIISKSV